MEEIDAVVTWVNGQDPEHRKKKQTYIKKREAGSVAGTDVDGRFFEAGEVKYCIHSIRKFAPWIRNIYLVTDEQCPAWLTCQETLRLNISIIDHRIIFRDHPGSLPTFNSISIESLLWKIPGLSEKYIVFNEQA